MKQSKKNYNISYSPEDNSLVGGGTGEEAIYEQDVYLVYFE